LPGITPAFAPIVAPDSDRILQVRIGGCEPPQIVAKQRIAVSHWTELPLSARSGHYSFELDFRKADTQNATLAPLPSLPWNVVANQAELRIAKPDS